MMIPAIRVAASTFSMLPKLFKANKVTPIKPAPGPLIDTAPPPNKVPITAPQIAEIIPARG